MVTPPERQHVLHQGTPVTEDIMRELWAAAVNDCVNGHEDCTFGGLSIPYGYWLFTDDCPSNHGERCVWCAGEATDMFRGRIGAPLVGALYGVPSCAPCGAVWVGMNPGRWER